MGFLRHIFGNRASTIRKNTNNASEPCLAVNEPIQKNLLEDLLMDTPTPFDKMDTAKLEVLMPSPFEYNANRPTPIEKAEDIKELQDALAPSPINVAYQKAKLKVALAQRKEQDEVLEICRRFDYSFMKASQQNSVSLPLVTGVPIQNGSETCQKKKPTKYKRKKCSIEGCNNLSRSNSKCKAHGGGRRCMYPNCGKAAQSGAGTKGSYCITHGGGSRCTVVEGGVACGKAAQSKGLCKRHGGGIRCKFVDERNNIKCPKSSQGNGYCRSHGGGSKCIVENCQKWAQRNKQCMEHSRGAYGNSYRGRIQRSSDNS